jgi:pimeloyl-ACP methyl ester carboxylesterase
MKNQHSIVNGLDIAYIDHGAGPLLLFLHGWGTDASSFNTLTAQFSNYRCVVPSLPGFGESELPRTPWGVSQYVEFVRDFLAKLDISPDMIVAHSLGGRVAIKGVGVGILNPKKLVLIASAGVSRKSARTHSIGKVARIVKVLTIVPPLSFLREHLKHLAGSRDYRNAGAMRETFVKVVNENLEKDAEKIALPTLLIWGEKDVETPLTEAYTLRERIRGSRLEVISDAGHFAFQEQPIVVAEKIKSFL